VKELGSHRRVLWLCAILLLTGCVVFETARPEPPVQEAVVWDTITPPVRTPVPTVVPTEQVLGQSGLLWRECDLSYLGWEQAETCLGHPLPVRDDTEEGRFGMRTDRGLVLQDGQDVYEARSGEFGPLVWSALYKNGQRLRTTFDGTPFHSPNISLQLIDGKVAWEFYGERWQTIIYDGQDLRSQYGLDAAYRPYELDSKLIFIGRKDDKYFIVYDGKQVGSPFDEITIGYCCEIALYAPRFGAGRYVFWGKRGDGYRLVEIARVGQASQ
jgi:hypothetical protein